MALQGSLRDFSATEILQLLGMQQKTGCLFLERMSERLSERVAIYVVDGRIVSTRHPGMHKDDTLLRFLRKIHRLSEEQHIGIDALQRESRRDFEDILITGRYVDANDLAIYIERQILDDITRVVKWDIGVYRFETTEKWDLPIRVKLSMEGCLIEAARRLDEFRRCADQFSDPDMLLGVHDLPDPDEPLSEEEAELFGIIDGRHTLAEVIEEAPLTESEAYEAIDRMMRARWIEFVGRRESTPAPAVTPVVTRPELTADVPVRHSIGREIMIALAVLLFAVVLFQSGQLLRGRLGVSANDVFVTSQIRDLRYALELFKRERGAYPSRLEELAADRWVAPSQLKVPGHEIYYHLAGTAQAYELRLDRKP